MISITLPNFFSNFKINNQLYQITKHNIEWFKIPVNFSSVTGNFPYCYWNGGYNTNYGPGSYYDDFTQCSVLSELPLRFNCSNIYLTETDYNNTLANLILSTNENGSNTIELADFGLLMYLNKKYPNYKFCWSKEAIYLYDENTYTPALLNDIIDKDIFKLVSVPETWVLKHDILKTLHKKSKVEIPINTCCKYSCDGYHSCKIHEHEAQFNYSKNNRFQQCVDRPQYDHIKPLISLEDIQEFYIPMGFTHYSLAETVSSDRHDYINFLVNYFIKDEYKFEAYKLLLGVN